MEQIMQVSNLILSLTLLFSLSTKAAQSQSDLPGQIKEARKITNEWMAKKSKGLVKKDIFEGQIERADYIISGIPKHLIEVNSKGVVYRHYTGKATQIILETNQLKTGITPYVIMNTGFSREVYEDVVGMFLTTPQTPPEKVGLPRNPDADYIDFTVFEGTPVVQIEKEIFVIPGRPDLPMWIKNMYLDYKNTGRYDSKYLELFKKIDARGGVNPTFMKINIISYKLNGKVYKK
jgi:hypothetical protein